jgi:hypothetical protein
MNQNPLPLVFLNSESRSIPDFAAFVSQSHIKFKATEAHTRFIESTCRGNNLGVISLLRLSGHSQSTLLWALVRECLYACNPCKSGHNMFKRSIWILLKTNAFFLAFEP